MVQGLARNFGDRGVCINVAQPGPTETDKNSVDEWSAVARHSMMTLKPHGSSRDVAGLVARLVGPVGGSATGTTLTMDGALAA